MAMRDKHCWHQVSQWESVCCFCGTQWDTIAARRGPIGHGQYAPKTVGIDRPEGPCIAQHSAEAI